MLLSQVAMNKFLTDYERKGSPLEESSSLRIQNRALKTKCREIENEIKDSDEIISYQILKNKTLRGEILFMKCFFTCIITCIIVSFFLRKWCDP